LELKDYQQAATLKELKKEVEVGICVKLGVRKA